MIPLYKAFIPESALAPLSEIFRSGRIADGEHVRSFEEQLAAYIGNPHVVSCGDISSALTVALYAAGVRAGDEVIASPLACVATNMPVLNLAARVRWCDIDPGSGLIDIRDLATQAASRARAVIYPLWAGDVVDIDAVRAAAPGMPVIEDAGEALGSECRGRRIGTTGADYTVFSFHAIRHITTGEGAAIACRDAATAERVRWLKRYGIHRPSFRAADGEIDPASDIFDPGYNSYMTQIAGAIGCAQMKRLPEIVERHRANGRYFDDALKGVPGIAVIDRPPDMQSSYWVYTLRAERRDDLRHALGERGVHASRVHLRNDIYSVFGESKAPLPGMDAFDRSYLCIPSGWWISDDDREAITAAIRKGW